MKDGYSLNENDGGEYEENWPHLRSTSEVEELGLENELMLIGRRGMGLGMSSRVLEARCL